MGRKRKQEVRADLLATVEVLHANLTSALCQDVFSGVRGAERQRVWTLQRLAEFWTAVTLRAPQSLTQALQEAAGGTSPMWPKVEASPQAFFSRCQDLKWEFFRSLYEAFVDRATATAPPGYAAACRPLLERFTSVWVVDGSRLDAIAHRMKILWDNRAVILPGCLTAFYDLFQGVAVKLLFDPDAASAELLRAEEALDDIPKGTLLLGDRLYCSVRFFQELTQRGLYAVTRRNKTLKLRKIKRLSKKRVAGGILTDTVVEAGCGVGTPRQRLRRIRWQRGKQVREVLTNVLDPKLLSAEEALSLYPKRWSVERLFFDLKEVLNLHQFYAANPNAIAMQVYAAAMVHTAMRIAQARIAHQAGILPELISTEKLFPRVAAASMALVGAELGFLATCQMNPRAKLKKPDWHMLPFATVLLDALLVEERRGKRRLRRFCKARRRWKSLAHVKGSGVKRDLN